MKKIFFIITLFLLSTACLAQTYTVERVIDSDTLKLSNGEEVQLIGIDVAEKISGIPVGGDFKKYDEYDGNKAMKFVRGLVKPKHEVRLEYDVEKKDKYGGVLAYVYVDVCKQNTKCSHAMNPAYEYKTFDDGHRAFIFLNATIIKAGYASPMTIPPNVKYADLFKELYEEAREKKRGLWREKETPPRQSVRTSAADSKRIQDKSPQRAISLMNDLVFSSSYKTGIEHDTRYIQDPNVLLLLANQLSGENRQVRMSAYNHLLKRGKQDDLKGISSDIKGLVKNLNVYESARLEAIVGVSEDRKSELLEIEDLDIDIRAKLGDANALNKIIRDFKNTDDFRKKWELSEKLAYIAAPECATVLARELNNDMIDDGVVTKVSIRFYILQALGNIYPDEILFTSELTKIKQIGDGRYGHDDLKVFAQQVGEWIARNLRVTIKTDWPILYEIKIVERYY